jgi:hypothetical protein
MLMIMPPKDIRFRKTNLVEIWLGLILLFELVAKVMPVI